MTKPDVWKLRIRTLDRHDDLEVPLPPGATIGQLAAAIDLDEDLITVDGENVPANRSFRSTGARPGSTIGLTREGDAGIEDGVSVADTPAPLVALDQIAGLAGVGSTTLAQGRYDFTPASGSPTTDYRVSDISFSVNVGAQGKATIVPRGRPVVVDDVLILEPHVLDDDVLHVGSARFQMRDLARDDAVETRTESPRLTVSSERRVHPPALRNRKSKPLSNMWLALAPLAVVFGVLGLLVHNVFFVACIPLLSMTAWHIVTHLRGERVANELEHDEIERLVTKFEEDVRAERKSLAAALRSAQPSIPAILAAAEGTDPEDSGIWNRHVGDHDFGLVSTGLGDLSWKVGTESVELHPLLQAVVRRNTVLPSVPIVLDVADGTIGIAGDRSSALSCARALLTSLVTQSSPESLRLALVAENGKLPDWDWTKWLPHFDAASSLATTPTETDRLVSSWRTPGHEWLQVVIVDQPDWARDDHTLLCTVAREPGKQVIIVLGDQLHDLPECAATIELSSDGTASVVVGPTQHRFVTPIGASPEVTERIVARIAGFADRATTIDDGEQMTTRNFVLTKQRIDPVLKSQIRTSETLLVPPPIPATAERRTIDLRERIDALAEPIDAGAVDEEFDHFA